MGRGLSSPPARLVLAQWRLQRSILSTVSLGSGPHHCLGSCAAVKTFMGSPAMFMGHSGIRRWNGDLSVTSTWLTRDCLLFACPQHPRARSGVRTDLGIAAVGENGGGCATEGQVRGTSQCCCRLQPPGDGCWPQRGNVLPCRAVPVWAVLLCKRSAQPRSACCCLKERCSGDLRTHLRQQGRKRF